MTTSILGNLKAFIISFWSSSNKKSFDAIPLNIWIDVLDLWTKHALHEEKVLREVMLIAPSPRHPFLHVRL